MIDDVAAGKIASALVGNKITVFLDLSGNAFKLFQPTTMRYRFHHHSLIDNEITNVGAISIAQVLVNNRTLTHLSLSGWIITL